MVPEDKSPAEIKAENDLVMAKAALKVALTSFHDKEQLVPPDELQEFWSDLGTEDWKAHLTLFELELAKVDKLKVKEILHDLENYINDCKKLVDGFDRSKAEVLLMIAIGQINVQEFIDSMERYPENKERLDRRIEKEIKKLDWEDEQALDKLDKLTERLEDPKIKKAEVDSIDKDIDAIEENIQRRKRKRDELAVKLVEWKARGVIDIAAHGKTRLDA